MREFRQGTWFEMVKALLTLAWLGFRHALGWSGRVDHRFRKPTLSKHSKRSFLFLLMGGLFLIQGFLLTHKMIETYANRSLAIGIERIAVDEVTYQNIQEYASSWDALSDDEIADYVNESYVFRDHHRERMQLPLVEASEVIATLKEQGVDGFQSFESFSHGRLTLRDLDGEAGAGFTRLLGMVFLMLMLAMLFMPLAIRQKNLAATSDHQEWLFSLPIKESELLAGTFVSSVLIRPLAYLLLWPLMTNLLIANGVMILLAAILGLVLTFLLSLVISGVEILLDTWMRARAPAVVLKNAQMIFSVLGLLSFYAVLAASIAGDSSFPWVNWLAVRLPGDLGEPVGEVLVSSPGVIVTFALGGALVIGLGSCALAGRFMRTGWLSGNGLHSKNRGRGKELKGGNLLKFEGLLLLRDRTLATQVILVPIMIVGYQVLINPAMVQSITAAGICAMAYACGTYASLITAPQILMSEAKGIWLIYNLPVPVGEYFSRREKLWRSVATGIAGLLIVVMATTGGAFRIDELWRYVLALWGVLVVGRVVSGVVMGKPKMPDVASGEMAKIGAGRMYGAMILAGIYGALLWQGEVWPLVSFLVIFWFLGEAIWQRRNISFNYLMEPVEEEPPSWGVDDGLWAVVVFLMVQVGVAAIGAAAGGVSSELVLGSFVAGGVVAVAFVKLRQDGKGIPFPELAVDGAKVGKLAMMKETAFATVLCLAVGIGWAKVLATGVFGEVGAGGFEWNPVVLIFLTVVAAPILEELLFRGFICRIMLAFWSKKHAIFGSALIFAIVHPGTSFPPVFLLGLMTAILYFRSRSVIPGMALHALYNLGIVGWALWG